jgi:hypothetical protein
MSGGNSLFVFKLRLSIPGQQNAEAIEPGNMSLRLYPVPQNDTNRNAPIPDVLRKDIVKSRRACRNQIERPPIIRESWLGEFGQRDKWSFCLTAARMAAEQEKQ